MKDVNVPKIGNFTGEKWDKDVAYFSSYYNCEEQYIKSITKNRYKAELTKVHDKN